MTTKKEEFVSAFKEAIQMHPNDFKTNPKGLAAILNASEHLTELFRAAVEEATQPDDPAVGLNLLFGE